MFYIVLSHTYHRYQRWLMGHVFYLVMDPSYYIVKQAYPDIQTRMLLEAIGWILGDEIDALIERIPDQNEYL